MRASTLLCSLFVAGALGSPFKRDYTLTDEVVVMVTLTTVLGGPEPTTTPELPVPTTTHHHRYHKVIPTTTSVVSLEPTSVPLPSSSTSTPPPPSSTSTPPPPPPPPPQSSTSTPPPPPLPSSTAEPTPVPTKQASSTPASDGSPLSGGVSLLTTANQFRSLYGLSSFKWDSQLEQNALKTGTDDGGVNEIHELNPGSLAQVITPGMATPVGDLGGDTPFQLSYAAWLCEVSSDPELKSGGTDQCQLVANTLHMEYSDTGHHDILTSPDYTAIGCAFAPNPNAASDSPYQGLWVCDLH